MKRGGAAVVLQIDITLLGQEELKHVGMSARSGKHDGILASLVDLVGIYAGLHEITLHLVLGSLLACGVVMLFMRSWSTTLIAGIAIPTSVVATAGSSQVTVSFAVPGNNGGSAITGYTATCGAQSMSGAASPIVVVGLSNGVAVTCTVIASNGIGNSAPSAASNSVTPTDLLFANGFD